LEQTPDKPQKRVQRNGRLVKLKKPTSAQNAKPKTKKVKYVTRNQRNDFFTDVFDGRTLIGKRYFELQHVFSAHLCHDLTEPERQLVDQVARLCILSDICWAELMDDGVINDEGQLSPAFDGWLRTSRDQRAVLSLLGLKRREKEVVDLAAYIAKQKASGD